MTKKNESSDPRKMTADSIGVDILGALVTEIKLLPDVWPRLSKAKQDDVIDRLRKSVQHHVDMAVHIIVSDDRTVVAGTLEKVTIKGNVEAVIKFDTNTGNLPELFAAAADKESKAVLVVVADSKDYTQGMDSVRGEDDQRSIDMGHEYKPNSDGDGMDDKDVSDTEVIGLPESVITQEDLDKYYNMGHDAAEEGKEQADCPMADGDLVAKWIRGWKDFHEQNPGDESTGNRIGDIE